jgi:hypothetical protein
MLTFLPNASGLNIMYATATEKKHLGQIGGILIFRILIWFLVIYENSIKTSQKFFLHL